MKLKKEVNNFLFGSMEMSNSPSGTLNSLDLKKSLRHLTIVVAGAAATAAIDFLIKWLANVDLGQYQLLATMAINSGLLEIIRRYISSNLSSDSISENLE